MIQARMVGCNYGELRYILLPMERDCMRRWMVRASISLMLCVTSPAWADRISRMSPIERCVYSTQLAVAGYYHFLEGKTRAEITIYWHGDGTLNEVDFVNGTLDAAFAIAEQDRMRRPQQMPSAQAFGDSLYQACKDASGE